MSDRLLRLTTRIPGAVAGTPVYRNGVRVGVVEWVACDTVGLAVQDPDDEIREALNSAKCAAVSPTVVAAAVQIPGGEVVTPTVPTPREAAENE